MINFLYPTDDFDFSIYNKNEQTFVKNSNVDPWSVEWLFDFVEIPYQNLTKKKKKSYIIFQFSFPTEFNDLSNIPDNIWKILADDPDVYLLLYQPAEAVPFYFWDYRWNKLKDFLRSRNILSEKVKFICGDIKAKENHKINYDDYWSYIDVLGLDIIQLMHYYRHNLYNKSTNFDKNFKKYFKNKNRKKFLCLNRRLRPSKQALIYYLKKYDYFDKSLTSSLWTDTDLVINKEEFDLNYNFDNSEYDDFVKKIQVKHQIEKVYSGQQTSPPEMYINTDYSLVSETYTGNKVLLISEKTYKPIVMGHPFLIHGNTGTLSYLKDNGYETFPEMFDESYDLETDPKKQLKKVIENLNNDFFLSKITIEKILHNREHFLKLFSKEIIRQKIEEFL